MLRALPELLPAGLRNGDVFKLEFLRTARLFDSYGFHAYAFKCTREASPAVEHAIYTRSMDTATLLCILEKMTSAEFKRWIEKHGCAVRTKSWAEGWLNG